MVKPRKWFRAEVIEEASKYSSRGDFSIGSPSAYNAMRHQNLYAECGFKSMRIAWTADKIQKEANKYQNRSAFSKKSPNAYAAAVRRSILDDVCVHMAIPQKVFNSAKRSDEELIALAKTYTDKSVFRLAEAGAYAALKRRHLLEMATAHMYVKEKRFTSLTGRVSGVYILYNEGDPVYVGKSENLQSRLGMHVTDGKKQFDSIEILQMDALLDMHVIEAFMIAAKQPMYNSDMVELYGSELTVSITGVTDAIAATHYYTKTSEDTWKLINGDK